MSRTAIRLDVLKLVVADRTQLFSTKDVSEDERLRRAHPELARHTHFHAFVGGALSDHAAPLEIKEERKSTPRGSIWRKLGVRLPSSPPERSAAGVSVAVSEPSARSRNAVPYSGGAVREGHLRAVAMIEDLSSFHETRRLYEHHLGAANVYFRPTEKGFTVMSLDFERCASMIGVSGRDTGEEYLGSIPPTSESVAAAYAGYCSKRDSLRRNSEEERFALRCIRNALVNGLQLRNSNWWFVHQEWRFPSAFDVGKLDLLAVDLTEGRLVVIELKESAAKASLPDKRGRTAEEQADAYADLLVRHREELYPFFQRLARAMATAYDGPPAMKDLELDLGRKPKAAVWWPT